MKRLWVLAALPLWFLVAAPSSPPPPPVVTTATPTATTAATPTPTPIATPPPPPPPPPTPPPPSPSPSPSPPASPSPNPNAYLTLDVTSGGPNTVITVSGSLFLPNQAISLYWDQSNRVSGAGNADASGNFTTKVQPFPGDPTGVHKLCASVAPNPCASFALKPAAVSPSPDASPSPDTSPSPTPVVAPTPARVDPKLSGLDVILKPPFVILPIIGGVGPGVAFILLRLSPA